MPTRGTPDFLRARQDRIRRALREARLDALVTGHIPNIRYASAFTGSTAMAVLTPEGNWLLVDPRYTSQARAEVQGASIRECLIPLEEAAGELLAELKPQQIGYERRRVSVDALNRMRRPSPLRAEWRAGDGILESLRAVKDAHELAVLRRAAKLTWESCDDIIRLLVAGVSERDIAVELEYRLIRKGAAKASFETIVASGRRSALPHGTATRNKLQQNVFVVVDFGIVLDGYCSDMTRTFYIGRPGAKEKRIYQAVQEALEATEAGIREGVTASQADAIARASLSRRKLGAFFTHSTGHGVGLEVHEFPSLRRHESAPLARDMVVTVEPGVYIPDWGGVRIEDMVVVGSKDCEILTRHTHELICA